MKRIFETNWRPGPLLAVLVSGNFFIWLVLIPMLIATGSCPKALAAIFALLVGGLIVPFAQ